MSNKKDFNPWMHIESGAMKSLQANLLWKIHALSQVSTKNPSGWCWASIPTLAEYLNESPSTIQRAIKWLADNGYIIYKDYLHKKTKDGKTVGNGETREMRPSNKAYHLNTAIVKTTMAPQSNRPCHHSQIDIQSKDLTKEQRDGEPADAVPVADVTPQSAPEPSEPSDNVNWKGTLTKEERIQILEAVMPLDFKWEAVVTMWNLWFQCSTTKEFKSRYNEWGRFVVTDVEADTFIEIFQPYLKRSFNIKPEKKPYIGSRI